MGYSSWGHKESGTTEQLSTYLVCALYLWLKYITETWVTNKNEIPLELHGFHKVGVLVENCKQFSILETCPKQRSVAL